MTSLARRIGIGLLVCVLGGGAALARGWQHIGKVQRVEKLKDGVELYPAILPALAPWAKKLGVAALD